MKLSHRAILNNTPPLPTPSLEDELHATEAAGKALQATEQIDSESEILNSRLDKVETYLSEKTNLLIRPEEITPKEIEEIVVLSEYLNEGTGITYSDVMPSNESENSTVSLESLKEFLRVVLESASRLVDRLIVTIEGYWHLFITQLGGVVNRAKIIRTMAQGANGRSPKGLKLKLEKGIYFSNFCRAGKYPGSYETLDEFYSELLAAGTYIFSEWNRNVIDTGITVIDELEASNVQNIETTLTRLNTLTKELWDKLEQKYATDVELMGNIRLEHKTSIVVENESEVETARKLQQRSLKVVDREITTDETVIVFKTLSLHEIESLMGRIIRMGEKMHDDIRRNHLPRLSRSSRAFVRAASIRIGSGADFADENRYQNRIDFTYRYASKYLSWVRSPAMDLSSTMIKVSRAIEALATLSLAEYE